MQAKHVGIIVVILVLLSLIPFIFGKKAPGVTTQDVFNNLTPQTTLTPQTPAGENGAVNRQEVVSPAPEAAAPAPSPKTAEKAAVKTTAPAPNTQSQSASSPEAPATPTAPASTSASIASFTFSPGTITVRKGATVTWTNNDNVPHTVTAQGGAFDSGLLSTGSKFSFTFSTVGTYDYICSFHPSMHGSVVVTQ